MKGIVASSGMAFAPAYFLSEPNLPFDKKPVEDAGKEIKRFRRAVSGCAAHLGCLMAAMEDSVDSGNAEILDFQLLMLEDTDFLGEIEGIISEQRVNAEYAVKTVSDNYNSYLEALTDNDYLRERTADVADLSQRLVAVLSGIELSLPEPATDYIAVGADIPPSRIAALDKNKLKGILLEKGGVTSHSVILSKSLGIPCLIETTGILTAVKEGEPILLDGVTGEAVINPDAARIQKYRDYISAAAAERERLKMYVNRRSVTQDGAEIKVFANITMASEAVEMMRQGGEGVGLFRSELLYMIEPERLPSEETQYAVYSEAAKSLGGKPLVIRTLDIGGDKKIAGMEIGAEENPFLGYRAIRFCLDHPEIFKPQISAILRAGADGNVRMMFPMITGVSEIRKAKQILNEVKNELRQKGEAFDPDMKIGIMVETPAAAFDAARLAKEVDFFSIGTNDLTQYLFAADRGNAKVVNLNSYFQPALLRLISSVVEAAHRAGIEADICGQAAEADALVPVWAAVGVDALSVSIPRITAVRERICNLRKSECLGLLDEVLKLDSTEEAEQMLCKFLK